MAIPIMTNPLKTWWNDKEAKVEQTYVDPTTGASISLGSATASKIYQTQLNDKIRSIMNDNTVLGGVVGTDYAAPLQTKRRTSIYIEEVANGKVVTIGNESWVVTDGQSVLEVIGAALASNKLGIK